MKNENQSDSHSDNFGRNLFILLMAFFLSLKLHSKAMPVSQHDRPVTINVVSTR